MKGFLFDENLPTRLRFSPRLPIVPTSKIGRNPSDSPAVNPATLIAKEFNPVETAHRQLKIGLPDLVGQFLPQLLRPNKISGSFGVLGLEPK